MKIAYCGYDFFSQCLQTLLSRGEDVYRAFTFECNNRFDFNQYLTEICQQHSIPLTDKPIDVDTLKQLQEEGCELLITAGYPHKIPDLTGTGIKGINFHPTLLPIGRSPWPLPWTILTGQERSGVTIHKLTPEFDAGDILLQEDFPLESNENLESLSAKHQILARTMLPRLMENFSEYWQNASPQEGDHSYWPRPTDADRTLDWNTTVSQLDRLSRSFGKMGCYGKFDGQYWLVYRLLAWPTHHHAGAGTVVHKTNTEIIVAAADGLVSLQYFEPAPWFKKHGSKKHDSKKINASG
jgi:methionyl-tRNA formyltransferase